MLALRTRGMQKTSVVLMKTMLWVSVLALLLLVPASPCFALWGIAHVSPEDAKKLGMQVRSKPAGSQQVRVELEFKLEGALKDFSRVDLRIGAGDNPPVTAPLREDRSKPGHVAVSFNADSDQLGNLRLWLFVPETDGGSIYDLRVKDFVQ
jgi:hypothetical protein